MNCEIEKLVHLVGQFPVCFWGGWRDKRVLWPYPVVAKGYSPGEEEAAGGLSRGPMGCPWRPARSGPRTSSLGRVGFLRGAGSETVIARDDPGAIRAKTFQGMPKREPHRARSEFLVISRIVSTKVGPT